MGQLSSHRRQVVETDGSGCAAHATATFALKMLPRRTPVVSDHVEKEDATHSASSSVVALLQAGSLFDPAQDLFPPSAGIQ